MNENHNVDKEALELRITSVYGGILLTARYHFLADVCVYESTYYRWLKNGIPAKDIGAVLRTLKCTLEDLQCPPAMKKK